VRELRWARGQEEGKFQEPALSEALSRHAQNGHYLKKRHLSIIPTAREPGKVGLSFQGIKRPGRELEKPLLFSRLDKEGGHAGKEGCNEKSSGGFAFRAARAGKEGGK